jgi:tetratricopeptide (TPR) repeat protein
MKDQIRSLFSLLEQDPTNEEAMSGLEEIVTGDESESFKNDIEGCLVEGRRGLVRAGHFEAACKVIDLELSLAKDQVAEVELLKEQARMYEDDIFDQKAALTQYEKALSIVPGDEELEMKVEAIQAERENWKQIVDKFLEQAEGEDESTLKAHMLYGAAERTYKNHRRGKDIPQYLLDALAVDPTHVKAARLLERVLRERGRFEELAEMYGRLSEHRRTKSERIQMMLAAAQVYSNKLNDEEAAAVMYSQVLDMDPSHKVALRYLVQFYEKREKWDHLVSVYEDALAGNVAKDDEAAIVLQAGMVHWKMQGAFDKAEKFFKRLRKLDPSHQGMIAFYRAFAEHTGDKTELLQVLSDAQRGKVSIESGRELTREIARLAAADGGNVERAIDAFKEILRKDPDSEEAKSELKRLYRVGEKWNALLDLLKAEAESKPDSQRDEKIGLYREMAAIYQQHLGLGTMVIKSYKTILDIDPDNAEIQDALSATFEAEGRWNDLINLVSKRAAQTKDTKERVRLLNHVADLWIDKFNNFNRAVEPLEEILAIDSKDTKAIASLKQVYTKRRAWRQLLDLYEKEAAFLEGSAKEALLEEMAELACDRLSDYEKAVEIWTAVLAVNPASMNAVNALEKLTERLKDWEGLCETLDLKAQHTRDIEEKIALLTKLGTIFKDRLKDTTRAADAWKRILDIQPGNAKAVRSLKEAYLVSENWDALETLYLAGKDYEGLVEVLGIAADRTSDPQIKMKLSFRCAEIYEEFIDQPERAARHYERVLAVDAENERSAKALVPLYKRTEKWNRLLAVFEIVLKHTADQVERASMMDEMREIAAGQMNNRGQAFEWASRAFKETPTDEGVRQTLEEAADAANAFEELVNLYKQQIDSFVGEDRLAMERRIATLCLERLGSVEEAVSAYRAILKHTPSDEPSLSALENIFRTTARIEELIEVLDRRISLTADNRKKREYHMQAADLYEEGLGLVDKAKGRYRTILSLFDGDKEAMSALERIAQTEENWAELAEILTDQCLMDGVSDADWHTIMGRLAALYDKQLHDASKAVSLYEELLQKFPGDETTIAAMEHFLREDANRSRAARILEPHLVQVENWRILAWVLSVIIEDTSDRESRLEMQFRLADVYADKLNDERLAFETLGAALKERPENEVLWNRMSEMAVRIQALPELADRLEEAYSLGKLTSESGYNLAERLAEILEVKLGRAAAAAPYHARVFASNPESKTAFVSLETMYTAESRWDDLISLYRRALKGGAKVESALGLQLKICFVLEEIQHNVEPAIDAYREVLEMDPGNPQAVHALTGLYEEVDRWQDLALLLKDRLQTLEGDELIAIRYRLGELNERFLNNNADALSYYEQVLTEDTNHLRAQEALERLLDVPTLQFKAARILEKTYEAQGAAMQLTRVLMIEIREKGIKNAEKIDILTRTADLRERRLNDALGAFEVLGDAFLLEPSNDYVRAEIKRVAEQYELNVRFTDILDLVIPEVKDDFALSADLILTAAKLYDEKLGDFSKAEAMYRKMLDLDRENPDTAIPAIIALDRMLSASEQFEQLLEVLRIKSRLVDDAEERKAILHRMAEIEESVLHRTTEAIALFQEVLEIDEQNLSALAGLERLYEQQQNWPSLVNILKQRSDVVASGPERRNLLYRTAVLFEEKLNNVDEAIASYNQVNLESGPDSDSLHALQRLFARTERWTDLLDVYEAEESIASGTEARAALCYKMGDLLCVHLEDQERAVERLGETLRLSPAHADALKTLESMMGGPVRKEVIGLLRPIYEAESNFDQILKCDEIMADEVDDSAAKTQILMHAAATAEQGLASKTRAFELLGRAFRSGASSADLVGKIVEDLERLSPSVDGSLRLVELYREITPDIMDGNLQIKCNLRTAEIAYREMHDAELARDYFVKVLDIDGENMQAMDSLEKIYEENGQYTDLFEIYRRKVQTLTDEAGRIKILFKQADVCETKLDDMSGAIHTYETILSSDPKNQDAVSALERLYPKAELWTDMMNLLERRAESEPDARADLLYRLGVLAEEKMADDERALDYFSRVLEVNPSHQGTLKALETAMENDSRRGRVAAILEPVYKRGGDWAKLVHALEARLEFSDDVQERKYLLSQIGTRYEEQLDDLESAFDTFARLYKEDIEETSTREVLSRLASALEIWPKLAEVYAGILEDQVGDTPTTADLAYVLGDIYERILNRQGDATAAYKRTLAFSPDNEKAFSAVERMYLATQNWTELLELYRDAADQSMDMDKKKAFIYKIADIQEGPGADLNAAIHAYCDVLEIDTRDLRAIEYLDRLYATAGRYEDLALHLRMQIDNAESAKIRNELRCRLGAVYEEYIKDNISAVDVYEEALRDEGGGIIQPVAALEKLIMNEDQRQRIADILEPVYRETDEWKKLIVILQTKVEYASSPSEKAAIWKETADLHQARGQNFSLAFQSLGECFRADPSDKAVLDELTQLAGRIEDWQTFTSMLSSVVEEIYDMDVKRTVLHLLGSTYDQRLDNPRKAISAYKGVLDIDESDIDALNSLEGLFNLVGDWSGLVGVLASKANLADDPLDRAQILRTKASIHEELMSEPKEAINSFQQALEADPVSTITMDALERLYEASSNWPDLVDIKRRRVLVTPYEEQRLDIQRSIAQVLENQLNDPMEAIEVWRGILAEVPDDSAAVSALDHLYTKESMFSELLDNLRLQKELAKDQALRVDILSRIGAIQENEMSNLEGAIESYRDVLLEQPTHKGAIEALTRIAANESVREQAVAVLEPIHREAGSFDRLAAVIELKLEILNDPFQRLTELLSLALIHETGLSKPQAAFDVYARALAEDPSRPDVMAALERIADAENLFKSLCKVYMERADNVYDASAEWNLLKRVGRIRETKLSDPKGAIVAYRRALDGGSLDVEILEALDRLYMSEHLWHELDEILEREIETSDSNTDINSFKLRQGTLRAKEFDDVSGAIHCFKDVIESDQSNREAASALEALLTRDEFVQDIVEILTPVYEALGRKEKIGELFEHRLRCANSDGEKVQLFKELALHHESITQDGNAAFDAYLKAFSTDPNEGSLLYELERLAGSLGAWVTLADAVEKVAAGRDVDPSQSVDLCLKVASWAAGNVGDPVKAEAMYRKVIETEPGHIEALTSLDLLLKSLGKFKELIPVMKQRAEAVYDFETKKGLFMEIADVARAELANIEEAKNAYLEIRNMDESDLDALDALVEIAKEQEDFGTEVDLLISRSDYTADMIDSNKYLHEAALLYLGPLGSSDKAVDLYRRILEKDPHDEVAAGRLRSLFEQSERFQDLRDFMMDQLNTAESDDKRIGILKALAALDETRFGELDDAVGHLNDVILMRPDDAEVVESLQRLYHKTERWQDLVELLEAQVDRARESGHTESELRLLVEIGEISSGKLDDPDRATDIYERVLDADPEHTRALSALAGLYEAKEDWEKCAEVLKRAAKGGKGDADEAEVHFRLARLFQQRMDDKASAAEELKISVSQNPSHVEANRALGEYCREVGDHQGMLESLIREEAHLLDSGLKTAKLVEIATLYSELLGDERSAVSVLERARELSPGKVDVLIKLSDAYVRAGRENDAIPVMEALIRAETDGGKKRTKQAAVYHQRLAAAYLSRGDQDKGLENLEAAYKLDIANTEVLLNLGKLHYNRGDLEQAAKLFRALLLQRIDPSLGISKADIYCMVGDISLRQGDPRKAKGMFRRGLDEEPNHQGCRDGVAKCG